MARRRWLGILLALALALWVTAGRAADEAAETEEMRVGREAAEQIEKQQKVADLPEETARLLKIVNRLKPHSKRPDVEYTVKILEGHDINAFSLPGSYIYVMEGTLKAVESEDELAAVLAHEMAHNCRGHGMDLLRREAKINQQLGVALLAILVGGNTAEPGNALLFGQLVKTAILNGHTRQAEYEADHDGVLYMYRAGYNPVGMLTVMEGFMRLANAQPQVQLGVFQTHPYPDERAEQLIAQLKALKVPINRRAVTRSLLVHVKEQQQEDERTIGQILIDDAVVFEAADGDNGETAAARAAQIGSRLSRQILDDLQMSDVQVGWGANSTTIYARGEPLIHVLPQDAALQNTSQQALVREVLHRLQLAFWREAVGRAS